VRGRGQTGAGEPDDESSCRPSERFRVLFSSPSARPSLPRDRAVGPPPSSSESVLAAPRSVLLRKENGRIAPVCFGYEVELNSRSRVIHRHEAVTVSQGLLVRRCVIGADVAPIPKDVLYKGLADIYLFQGSTGACGNDQFAIVELLGPRPPFSSNRITSVAVTFVSPQGRHLHRMR
jgi:hypothetical protein